MAARHRQSSVFRHFSWADASVTAQLTAPWCRTPHPACWDRGSWRQDREKGRKGRKGRKGGLQPGHGLRLGCNERFRL